MKSLSSILIVAAFVMPDIQAEPFAFFEKKIRPLLSKHCYKCHSAQARKLKGGLYLDSHDGWAAGGDSGEVILPGKPEESLLIKAVSYGLDDLQMPPKYKLSDAEIESLKLWIKAGAPDPRKSMKVAEREKMSIEEGRKFWAYQPIEKPNLPQVKHRGWPENDIDHFVLSRIEEKGMTPVRDASRETLIRRVTFDLIGLPPSPREILDFVSDAADDSGALATVVDRLLKSKHFGERWGRHWLDVARYAESMGRTWNYPFPYAWRYRDYVIAAFNKDKPYDVFIKEQIAGDLLSHENSATKNEHLTAVGFLTLGSMDLNERKVEQYRMDSIDEQIDTIGRAFMGMTLGCARCHDHKFDPVPTEDYYAMAGIFRSTELLAGFNNQNKGGGGRGYYRPELLGVLDGKRESNITPKDKKRLVNLRNKLAQIEKEVTQLQIKIVQAKNPKSQVKLSRDELDVLKIDRNRKNRGLVATREQITALELKSSSQILAMSVRESEKMSNARIYIRGEITRPGKPVRRGFIQVAMTEDAEKIPKMQSGRLQLASWLTSPQHPLTARVMVNRIWHHLFGRGIVPTVDNFGTTGERPTHPELLDYLASQFIKDGWSIKRLIKEIMLSRAYRMSIVLNKENYASDPSNQFFWRMNQRRLEVEAIRDSILRIGRNLDLREPGPSPVSNYPIGPLNPKSVSHQDSNFRSVYLPVLRSLVHPMFETFDFAETSSVTGRRDITTVATQALFMMNSGFVRSNAMSAAKHLCETQTDKHKMVKIAYRQALGRYPQEEEIVQAMKFITDISKPEGQEKVAAWGGLYHALFASAEFRYLN